MGVIYNPADDRIPTQIVDGVENTFARYRQLIATSALVLTDLITIPLPVETFNREGRVIRLSVWLSFLGAVAVDTKQTQIQIGTTTLWDTGLVTLNDLSSKLMVELSYGLSGMSSPVLEGRSFMVSMPSGGGNTAAPTFRAEKLVQTSFFPAVPQTLVIRARVQNAANSVRIDRLIGTIL